MAKKEETRLTDQEPAPDVERIKSRLDMLDQRLDNIDSVVTAIAERVMKRPVTFTVTCANCGRNIEIALIGTEKPSNK